MTEVTTGHAVTSTSSPVDALPEVVARLFRDLYFWHCQYPRSPLQIVGQANLLYSVTRKSSENSCRVSKHGIIIVAAFAGRCQQLAIANPLPVKHSNNCIITDCVNVDCQASGAESLYERTGDQRNQRQCCQCGNNAYGCAQLERLHV